MSKDRKKQAERITKFICRFLTTRQELRGTLRSLPCGTIRIELGTARPLQAPRPIPVTDAQDAEIRRLARELCGRFRFTVRELPTQSEDTRTFELHGG